MGENHGERESCFKTSLSDQLNRLSKGDSLCTKAHILVNPSKEGLEGDYSMMGWHISYQEGVYSFLNTGILVKYMLWGKNPWRSNGSPHTAIAKIRSPFRGEIKIDVTKPREPINARTTTLSHQY